MKKKRVFYKQVFNVTVISPDVPCDVYYPKDLAHLMVADIENDVAVQIGEKSCGKMIPNRVPAVIERMGYSRGYFDNTEWDEKVGVVRHAPSKAAVSEV